MSTVRTLALLLSLAGCQARSAPDVAPEADVVAEPVVEPPVAPPTLADAVVLVDGVEPGGSPVDVALQTEAQWGTDETAYRARVPADASSVAVRLAGVTPGRYGLLAVQPNLPPQTTQDGEADTTRPLPTFKITGQGGWAALGEDRSLPEWDAGSVTVADGATLPPLTLRRR